MGILKPAQILGTKIAKLMVLPCLDRPQIWLAMAEATIMYAAWDIISPDPKEVYHRVRGNSLLCDIKGAIRDAEILPPEGESRATRFLFEMAEHFDFALWYTFLIEAGLEGLIDATSMALKVFCKEPMGRNIGQGGPWFGGLDKDGGWNSPEFAFQPPSKFAPVSSSLMIIRPGVSWGMAAMATWEPFLPVKKVNVHQRLIERNTGIILDSNSSEHGLFDSTQTIAFGKGKNTTSQVQEWAIEFACDPVPSTHPTAATLDQGFCTMWNSDTI